MRQIATISDQKNLQELISSQFNDSLLFHQEILQHLNYLGFTPQIVQCNLQNPFEETNAIATANDTAAKILAVFNPTSSSTLTRS